MKQGKLSLKPFATVQFSYTPVIWMFHTEKINNLTKHIYDRDYYISYIKITPFHIIIVTYESWNFIWNWNWKFSWNWKLIWNLRLRLSNKYFSNNLKSIWLNKQNQVEVNECPNCLTWHWNCFFCFTKNLRQHSKKLQRF